MFIFTLHWDLRALFAALTITARFYIFGFMAAAVYSTHSSVRIAFLLNRVSKSLADDVSGARPGLCKMAGKVETLRQFHTFLFLLFGACCAIEVVAILRTIQLSFVS